MGVDGNPGKSLPGSIKSQDNGPKELLFSTPVILFCSKDSGFHVICLGSKKESYCLLYFKEF